VPEIDFDHVRETRARNPEVVAQAAANRRRRPVLDASGRLMIVAADHTARNALGVRSSTMAMENREELLARLVTALERPGVDGVLGSPDWRARSSSAR
jgi:hypothetical protein